MPKLGDALALGHSCWGTLWAHTSLLCVQTCSLKGHTALPVWGCGDRVRNWTPQRQGVYRARRWPRDGLRWGGSVQRPQIAHEHAQRHVGLDTQLCTARLGVEVLGLTRQAWKQARVLPPSTGALACRPRELGLGDALRVPRARGERRRHTITNGVDCDLVGEGSGGLSMLPGMGLGPRLVSWTSPPPGR